ncbi:alpha/beta fold hydrolase [Dyella kyungheensis]|uniref:alpha/beta fold hydrolase n=1 Tax=Dyella kyungheensis TaxID=1242174 RepID=UPI003CF11A66
MHWLEEGPDDAPAVVLIHGLGGDAQFWGVEQAALARHFRVLAVDLRGSGLSPGTVEAFSIEDLARDIESMLDEAGISSTHVIGFSMGGVVAQALAVASPQRIDRLVLAATFAVVNPQARLFLQAIGSVYRDGLSARQLYELVLPWLFSVAFLDDSRSAPYLAYPDEQGEEQSRDDWLSLLAALLAFDGRARLGAIRAPTLIISGDEDCLAPLAGAEELAHGIHGSVLKIVAGGHLMNVESPDEFIGQIERFLLPHRQPALA